MSLKVNEAFINLMEGELKAQYFLNLVGTPFVEIEREGKRQVTRLDKGSAPNFIRSIFRDFKLGKCSRHTSDNIIDDMISMAHNSGIVRQVFVRSGRYNDGRAEIDLGNGNFVLIGNGSWELAQKTNLSYWRPPTFKVLPNPVQMSPNEFVKLFTKYLNLANPEEYLLLLPALIKVMVVNSGDNVIIILSGGQGSGKTTTANFLKNLTDPADNNVLFPPKKIDDILASSQGCRFLVFDNLSYINSDMSDALCVICTGGSFSKRALFTDDIQKLYKLDNNLMLTGIGEVATRPDLLDRAVIISMAAISSSETRAQSEIAKDFEQDYANLFGGLVVLASKVLEVLDSVQTRGLPRMTEYSRFGIAVEKSLGLEDGTFLRVYQRNLMMRAEVSFDQDSLCTAIMDLLTKPSSQIIRNSEELRPGEFKGTLQELYVKLTKSKKTLLRGYSSMQQFGKHLDRIKPLLGKNGIGFEQLPRTKHKRSFRLWLLENDIAKAPDDIHEDISDQDLL